MNKADSQLGRLLQAAAQVHHSQPELSRYTEEKMISRWKASIIPQPRILWDTELYGPALTVGALVMTLSIFLTQTLTKFDIMGDWGQTITAFQQICNL